MITEIELRNFRCFNNHILPFRPNTIIVGRNNAGKSTIVEALRLVSIVTTRYGNLNYKEAPYWLKEPEFNFGISPSLKGMDINFESIFYRYGKPPGLIRAKFNSGESIHINLGPESEIFVNILDSKGTLIKNKGQARKINIPPVNILPQIGPLAREELLLREDYVHGLMSSNLASLHFRNQLHLFPEEFKIFKEIAESTWKGLQIKSLKLDSMEKGTNISLLIRDGDFSAEIGWMGHGLQMWLQTMWFLARAGKNSTIILDEPDVYLHADLQRKLIRLLNDQFKQTIVATHSIEIMAEVEPESILVVDRTKPKSYFTNSLPGVQRIINNMGGIHNIQLTRLWSSKKCFFVEGKDIAILKHFQKRLFPETKEPFDTIPRMEVGGWGNWDYALGSSMFLKNSANEAITCYCIFDRDYHTANTIQERYEDAKRIGVELHIWSLKEIENFLIIPEAIVRIINSQVKSKKKATLENVRKQLHTITDELYTDTLNAIGDELLVANRAGGFKVANLLASKLMTNNWSSLEGRLTIVSGKKVLSMLSGWAQKEFGVSFSINRVARELTKDEIHSEMIHVISSLENNLSL